MPREAHLSATSPPADGSDLELVAYRMTTLRPARRSSADVRMFGPPRVGQPMTLYAPGGCRIITTPVRRLLVDEARATTFVETDNSVYGLERG